MLTTTVGRFQSPESIVVSLEIVPLNHRVDTIYSISVLGNKNIRLILAGEDANDFCKAASMGPIIAIQVSLQSRQRSVKACLTGTSSLLVRKNSG